MLYSTDVRGRRPHVTVKERVILGKCGNNLCFRAPVVGRLISEGDMKCFYGDEALLTVVYGVCKSDEHNFFDDSRAVGAVFVSDVERPLDTLPLPSIRISDLPQECNGRIALLDPCSQRLFVSPDISTVNRYLPRLFQKSAEAHPTFLLRDGKKLSLSVICEEEDTRYEGDMLIPLPLSVGDEEELYLHCTEIAERAVGRHVTFLLSANDIKIPSVRALMRSAVWGELSILLCGILTEDELTKFMREYCRAFCELEGDGHEFNGYMPRGLCIDSPYLLSIAEGLHGIDFFIFDAERLVSLLCNGRDIPPQEVLSYALSAIERTVKARKDIWHGAILGNRTLSSRFCQALENFGVERYAVPPSYMKGLCRLL